MFLKRTISRVQEKASQCVRGGNVEGNLNDRNKGIRKEVLLPGKHVEARVEMADSEEVYQCWPGPRGAGNPQASRSLPLSASCIRQHEGFILLHPATF